MRRCAGRGSGAGAHVVSAGHGSLGRDAGGRRGRALAAQARRRGQHSIHVGHHGIAEGRAADASQPVEQCCTWSGGHGITEATGIARRCRLSLFRVRDGSLLAVVHGLAMVLPAATVRPAGDLAGHSTRNAARLIYGVPDHVHRGTGSSGFSRNYDLSTLRTGIMAGAPCPVEVMKRVVTECTAAA